MMDFSICHHVQSVKSVLREIHFSGESTFTYTEIKQQPRPMIQWFGNLIDSLDYVSLVNTFIRKSLQANPSLPTITILIRTFDKNKKKTTIKKCNLKEREATCWERKKIHDHNQRKVDDVDHTAIELSSVYIVYCRSQ